MSSASFSASSIAVGCAAPHTVENGELLQLGGRDLAHLLAVGVAELRAEEAREPVEVGVAVGVEDVRALAALEHQQRGRRAVAAEVQQQVVAGGLLQG